MAFFYFTDGFDFGVFRTTDAATTRQARDLADQGEFVGNNFAATIILEQSAYNLGWSITFDPSSIFFWEFAFEVSDSTFRLIEENIDTVGDDFLPDNLWTPWASQVLWELNPVRGSQSGEELVGSDTHDMMFGRDGNDILRGGRGNDQMNGGGGDDRLIGGRGDDRLDGKSGRDILLGGAGDDVLVASKGSDTLVGGAGADEFVFLEPGSIGRVVIRDFDPSEDVLRLQRDWVTAQEGKTLEETFVEGLQTRGSNLVYVLDDDTRLVLRGLADTGITVDDVVIL